MDVAITLADLGTCHRKKVGAIIVRDGRCVSWGYNGAPPGLPHCDYPHEPRDCHATHAEANALAFAARQGISTDGASLFVTVAPCETCARLLIAAGIRVVYFHEPYREEAGCHLLNRANVPTIQV